MPFQDSDTTGGKARLKHSATASESIAAAGLVPGELAINSADGVLGLETPLPVLTAEQEARVLAWYAADAALYASLG